MPVNDSDREKAPRPLWKVYPCYELQRIRVKATLFMHRPS